jgi:hypothetical protein
MILAYGIISCTPFLKEKHLSSMKLKGRKLLKKLPQVCYFMPSLSLSAK